MPVLLITVILLEHPYRQTELYTPKAKEALARPRYTWNIHNT
jgi:hypothetical protein